MARIYSLETGANLVEEILRIARKEKIKTARFEAIGGVNKLKLAYFNHKTKKYEEHDYDEFLEVTGLLGNITRKDGKPFVHAHGTFGRRDMSVIAGHLMSATVFPLLEVVITPTKNRATREFDKEVGLNVIQKIDE
ncbi:MAG TPA: PPC domain-containing DNA-binding protein [Nitrososphaerales archaeon]|nr:PPC domain-containing DNA-binding protein [Nitrososphaerales archaeon]